MDETIGRRRYLAGLAATAIGTATAGCSGGGDGGDGGDGNRVDMTDDLTYEPASITVPVGATVTWETVGTVGHSVTAYEEEIPAEAEYFASGGFDTEEAARDAYSIGDPESGDVISGETYSHTFEVGGTYGYFCIPHEGSDMVGTVVVEGG